MKAYFFTEGGRGKGFGHLTRCKAVAQALMTRNVCSEFIVDGDETVKFLIDDLNCKLCEWTYENSDAFIVNVKKDDLVIIDSYWADSGIYEFLSKKAGACLFFDDYKRIEYPNGIVVNPALNAESLHYTGGGKNKHLLGKDYIPLRKEFWTQNDKMIKENINNVFFILGGADIENEIPDIIGAIFTVFPVSKINMVGAKSKTGKMENINNMSSADAGEFKTLMEHADLAVSAGGQVLGELANTGPPTVCFLTADNQKVNIESMEKAGFLEYAGNIKDRGSINAFKKKLKVLNKRNERKLRSETGRSIADGRGALRISDSLISDFVRSNFRIEAAREDDVDFVFDLSNDKAVRENSFKSEIITYEEHVLWYKKKMRNEQCSFLICYAGSERVGQVRFDKQDNASSAVVSLSLHATIRGLGLSSFILRKACDVFLSDSGKVVTLTAYIKKENKISQKCFIKAGFNNSSMTELNGKEAVILTMEK